MAGMSSGRRDRRSVNNDWLRPERTSRTAAATFTGLVAVALFLIGLALAGWFWDPIALFAGACAMLAGLARLLG